MQFNSIEFLIFFIAFFAAYTATMRRLRLQNCLLLAASYLFYGWWDWRFLFLILLTTVTSYASALMAVRGNSKFWTSCNVAVNLGILVAFKYFNFFSENLSRLLSAFGWNVDWFTVDVLLPVGISFYTFQAIAYSVDVYKGKVLPERDFVTFATFIAFFPQLLAGPIERASQLLPQIGTQRRWDAALAVQGARETLWGLFKKVAIADTCGVYVDSIYANPDAGAVKLSVAAVLFFIQIYCDFSGYCNMARGLAAMLGIRLSVNFRYPMFSRSPSDYWRRWHITLMTWLRDYIYIPLGGSRRGKWRTCVNIMLVFFISGLWHGAAWHFIAWGVMWGVVMVAARLFSRNRIPVDSVPSTTVDDVARMLLMCYVATVTFVMFRADSLIDGVHTIVSVMPFTALIFVAAFAVIFVACRLRHPVIVAMGLAVALLVAAGAAWGSGAALAFAVKGVMPASVAGMIAAEWRGRRHSFALECMPGGSVWRRIPVYWLLIIVIMVSNVTGEPFIYYQF